MKLMRMIPLWLMVALLVLGCKEDDSDDMVILNQPPVGNFVDNYSGSHTISATRWINSGLGFTITKINGTDKYLIAQNDTGNAYNGGKYSRFDWTNDIYGDLYFCQIAYDKTSAADAEGVNTADSSSPSESGCGNFAWSKLTAFSELTGEFKDNYSYPHSISATRWVSGGYGGSTSGFTITRINTTDDYFIARNDSTNTYNPSKYSRFDWTKDISGNLYYCQISYDATSAADAEAVTPADDSDPANSGCGGFAWTKLTGFSELTGEFSDNWSGSHTITATRWQSGSSGYSITRINTTDDYFIARNDGSNAYNPSKYSRFDWTKDISGNLYYCQISYNSTSAADAEAVTPADDSDPANSGCGGFAWTKLAPFSELVGNFKDNYSYSHTISASRWQNGGSGYTITKINTTDDYFIALNDSSNAYNPSKYSRFDWTTDLSGKRYYCQITYDKTSGGDAEAVITADSSNLSTGCNGFAWSQLISHP